MKNTNINNRREFLKMGALAGLGLISSNIVKAEENKNTISSIPESQLQTSKRVLGSGKHQLEVSPIGLGCMGMSYHRSFVPDRQMSINLIRKAAELGLNLFDTAEAYGPMINEELVGEALQPIRKEILIATKFGFVDGMPSKGLDSRPDTIKRVVDQSLKRLRTDYIDLLYNTAWIQMCQWKR